MADENGQASIPLPVIQTRIRSLEAELAELRTREDVLQSQIQLLEGLTAHAAVHEAPETEDDSSMLITQDERNHATVLMVKMRPGLTAREIGDRLEHRVKQRGSKSSRKLITDTLYYLREDEAIYRDAEGRYFPWDHDEGGAS